MSLEKMKIDMRQYSLNSKYAHSDEKLWDDEIVIVQPYY